MDGGIVEYVCMCGCLSLELLHNINNVELVVDVRGVHPFYLELAGWLVGKASLLDHSFISSCSQKTATPHHKYSLIITHTLQKPHAPLPPHFSFGSYHVYIS